MRFILDNLKIKAVYFLLINDEIVYIGRTSNLKNRLYLHIKRYEEEEWKSEVNKIEYTECKTDTDTDILETYFINEYKPIYNKEKVYADKTTLNLGSFEFKEVPHIPTFEEYLERRVWQEWYRKQYLNYEDYLLKNKYLINFRFLFNLIANNEFYSSLLLRIKYNDSLRYKKSY